MAASGAARAPALQVARRRSRTRVVMVLLAVLLFPVGAILWLHSRLLPAKLINLSQVTHDGVAKVTVLSDGSFLYVTETLKGQRFVSRVNGSEASRLPLSIPGPTAHSIAFDHGALLLGDSDGELWTLQLSTSLLHSLGLTGHSASLAPDGQHVAYANDSELYVANSDGTQVRRLASVGGTVFYPRFFPDGKRIRFSVSNTVQNSTTTSLWEVGSDGAGLHPLFPGWHDPPGECCGSWTSDGRYYIFQVTQSRPANMTNLWALAEPAGRFQRKPPAKPVQLTPGPMSFGNAAPDPKSNGKVWALGVQPAGEFVKYDIGSNRFVPVLAGISGTDLEFSRDGKWVAYVAIPEGTLWRSRVDGSERMRLSTPPLHTALPHWSSDGTQIVYMGVENGKAWKILVVPAAGGTPQQLLPEGRNQVDANWSPDGRQIVFGDEWSADNPTIRILDLPTRRISPIRGSQGLFSPRWSPNGRFIAALSADFTTLMLFDLQAQKWSTWLTEPAGAVSYPNWSADSTYLDFEDLVTGQDSIRRIKIGQSKPQQVFVLNGLIRYPGPLGLWNGLATDGSHVFVRDRSTQEIYGLELSLP
jgi:Tol biopolymer transport system component